MRRCVVVAVVVLTVLAMAAPVHARGVERARMDITNVAGNQTLCPDGPGEEPSELLTYVGTLTFRGGATYDMAFLAPLGSGPDFYSWVKFEDRWEIYERGSLDPTGNTCPDPADEGFIRGAEDRGWGHFAKNKFIGWGPGGFWTGKFVDGDGNPARFLPPEGEFNTRFVGPFWLFGELDDD